MKCPYCGADNNDVTNTRARNDRVYRRRSCASCGMGFTTYEVYVPADAEIHSREYREKYTKGKGGRPKIERVQDL